jgi:hypothetical protein
LAIAAIVAAIILLTLIVLLQRRLLYFPDPVPPSPLQLDAAGLSRWPGQGVARGYVGLANASVARGTVLVFHGNAGAAWQRAYYVEALELLGYRVVLAKYPGYDGRAGSPSEAALVADGIASVEQIYQRYGEPIVLWGESLGSGVAAAVARQSQVPLAGLVLLTPWDSLPELAQWHYPLLPLRYLMRDQYDSIDNLKAFGGKVALLVAADDDIIPEERSMALYESLPGLKKLWRFAGAGHNSWPADPREHWWREVMDFVVEQ